MKIPRGRGLRALSYALLWCAVAALGDRAEAQPTFGPADFSAGSDAEDYLRTLQLVGIVPDYPWSIRAFSQRELAKLGPDTSAHPWRARFQPQSPTRRFSLAPARADLVWNSGFPHGGNDGAVWAGRGATGSVSLGFAGSLGPVSFALNPEAFAAQNSRFDLFDNGQAGKLAYGDALFSAIIDRPQRFGDAAYRRFDPGQTYLSLDALGLSVGVSTANQWWGPAVRYPFLLGNNAPGFAHAFVGTSRPVDLRLLKLHARASWGRLEQSEYSPVQVDGFTPASAPGETAARERQRKKRFAPALIFLIQPGGLRGLEFGFARFFHFFHQPEGISSSTVWAPFQSFLKKGLPEGLSESNQLVSAFVRWSFAPSGFEVYGEYGRDDHNTDFRDFIQEPDHLRSYMFGFAKAFNRRSGRINVVWGEAISFQLPTLARNRGQGTTYTHGVVIQGHTNRGQLLGANVAAGTGSASTLTWTSYHPGGKWSAVWTRNVVSERGTFFSGGPADQASSDVTYSLGLDAVKFRRSTEVRAGLELTRELNRHFSHDAWNVQLRTGVTRRF